MIGEFRNKTSFDRPENITSEVPLNTLWTAPEDGAAVCNLATNLGNTLTGMFIVKKGTKYKRNSQSNIKNININYYKFA